MTADSKSGLDTLIKGDETARLDGQSNKVYRTFKANDKPFKKKLHFGIGKPMRQRHLVTWTLGS